MPQQEHTQIKIEDFYERLKLSDWAKFFGATYDIIDKTELGESYACKDDFRRDLSFKEYI